MTTFSERMRRLLDWLFAPVDPAIPNLAAHQFPPNLNVEVRDRHLDPRWMFWLGADACPDRWADLWAERRDRVVVSDRISASAVVADRLAFESVPRSP